MHVVHSTAMTSDREDPASLALVDLRKAMGLSQQKFAVEILDSAITTVSRYETGNPPPRGSVLLRLREVASERGFPEIADRFLRVWLQDIKKALGPDVRAIVMEEGTGLLVASLSNKDEIVFAQLVLGALGRLDGSSKPEDRHFVKSVIIAFAQALRSHDAPGSHNMSDAFADTMARLGLEATFVASAEDTPEDSKKKKAKP
jgi:transcriptional regulator with XRE-family HTH domain